MDFDVNPPPARLDHSVSLAVGVGLALWFAAVVVIAATGILETRLTPWIAPLVGLGIVAPTVLYLFQPGVRTWVETLGLRRLTLLHVWRIAAALAFLAYGIRGELPPLFWTLAGFGDLLAGVSAATLYFRPSTTARLRHIHAFGFADFVVAVGTGLAYTLAHDPRMVPIRTLPLALIPLFGVGISGATHIMAFDLLRRGRGRAT